MIKSREESRRWLVSQTRCRPFWKGLGIQTLNRKLHLSSKVRDWTHNQEKIWSRAHRLWDVLDAAEWCNHHKYSNRHKYSPYRLLLTLFFSDFCQVRQHRDRYKQKTES